eukprot:2144001-Prymnesium_polylepis.1
MAATPTSTSDEVFTRRAGAVRVGASLGVIMSHKGVRAAASPGAPPSWCSRATFQTHQTCALWCA